MPECRIPYGDDLLVATGRSREEVESEFRFLLATKLFELRRLSLGKAAAIGGMSRLRFMEELAKAGVPVINLDDDQIADEVRDA